MINLQRSVWSQGAFCTRDVPVPDVPTQFDQLVARLGLAASPHLWQFNGQIRHFAKVNRTRLYVPESLLRELGFRVSDEECVA